MGRQPKHNKRCKMLWSLRKKGNKSGESSIPGEFSDKVTHDIGFTYKPIVQCNAPVIEILL